MVTPYEEYLEVAEALNELTPGDHEKRIGAVQLRRRGRRERRQGRPPLHRPPGGRRLRPRLPRPHQPHDGADRQEHAVQAPLRPVRRRDLPRADGLPLPLADRSRATAPRRRSTRSSSRCTRRSARTTLAAVILEPIQGEGGFIVPAPGFVKQVADWCTEQRHPLHRRRDPDRLLPHRRLVRLRARGRRARPHHHRQGHRRRPAARRRHRPRRRHGLDPRRRPRRHLRRQPGRLRRRARRHRDDEGGRPAAAAPSRSRPCSVPRLRGARREVRRRSATSAAAAPCSPSSSSTDPATKTPDAALTGRGQQGLPRRGSRHPDLRHVRQRLPLPAAAGRGDELLTEGLDILEKAFAASV